MSETPEGRLRELSEPGIRQPEARVVALGVAESACAAARADERARIVKQLREANIINAVRGHKGMNETGRVALRLATDFIEREGAGTPGNERIDAQ